MPTTTSSSARMRPVAPARQSRTMSMWIELVPLNWRDHSNTHMRVYSLLGSTQTHTSPQPNASPSGSNPGYSGLLSETVTLPCATGTRQKALLSVTLGKQHTPSMFSIFYTKSFEVKPQFDHHFCRCFGPASPQPTSKFVLCVPNPGR